MNSPAEVPDEPDPLGALHLQVRQQARQLEMVAGAVDEIETVLRDLPAAATTAEAGPAPTEDQGAEPAPFDFATLYTRVHIHVATITERKISKSSGSESGVGVRWCTRWYEHDEAIARLEALRRAWEEHVLTPGASMSTLVHHPLRPPPHRPHRPRRPLLAMQAPATTNPPARSDTNFSMATRPPRPTT